MKNLELNNLKELSLKEKVNISGGKKSLWYYISYAVGYAAAAYEDAATRGNPSSNSQGAHIHAF